MIRLNKYLASSLSISRRKADELISGGEVFINSEIASIGTIVNIENDIVTYQGNILKVAEKDYFIFYKPYGYICSRSKQGKTNTIYSLIDNKTLKYAGRLDKESEGLLLLSNDGDWINKLTHPRFNVKKVYIVKTSKNIDRKKFKLSINFNNDIYEILNLTVIGDCEYKVVLTTGKNREIRKIFKYNNINIVSLKRIQMGMYKLGNMKPGELIKLSNKGVV